MNSKLTVVNKSVDVQIEKGATYFLSDKSDIKINSAPATKPIKETIKNIYEQKIKPVIKPILTTIKNFLKQIKFF